MTCDQGQTPRPNRGYCMRRYRLPYWAFVPALGVWPDPAPAPARTGTVTGANVLPASAGTLAVNMENGRVTVVDATRAPPEVTTTVTEPPPPPPPADAQSRRRPPRPIKRTHPNTPSVGGPSSLRKTSRKNATATDAASAPVSAGTNAGPNAVPGPITKIYLKPAARAKAGDGGVALSNPISTALVRRGDTVSIEYMPDATAEAGQGGVAISRPELVIHFVDWTRFTAAQPAHTNRSHSQLFTNTNNCTVP